MFLISFNLTPTSNTPQHHSQSSSLDIRNPKALRSTLGETPQSRKINQQRPDGVVREPSLHLRPVILLRLLLRLRAARQTAINHPLDRAPDQRPEEEMARRQKRAIGVPMAHIRRLQS